jgi:hypothetical protein
MKSRIKLIYTIAIIAFLFGISGMLIFSNYGLFLKIGLTGLLTILCTSTITSLLKNENKRLWYVRYGIVFSLIGFSFFTIGFIKAEILHDFWNFALASILIGVACTIYSSLKFTTRNMEGFLPKICTFFALFSIFLLAFLVGSKLESNVLLTTALISLSITTISTVVILARKANN